MSTYNNIVRRVIPKVGFHQNHYARRLEECIPRDAVWLDLGAGTKLHDGYGVLTSAQLASRARLLVGIDPVTSHLSRNEWISAAAGAIGDALPFADGSFDMVTANMVIEHLEEPRAVFSEVLRVLRPGGSFVFVTPNLNHPAIRLADILVSKKARTTLAVAVEDREAEHVFPTFYRANTPRSIERLASTLGFARVNIEVHRNIPFFRRPAIATAVESLFIRACDEIRLLRFMGADIVAVLTK